MILNNSVNIKKLNRNYLNNQLYKKQYQYLILNLKKKKKYYLSNLNVGSIVIIETIIKNSKIKINNKEFNVNKYKFFNFSFKKIKIEANNKILIGIAGVKKKIYIENLKELKEKEVYKVKKPWGYELWINGQASTYSFKKIFIKKNNRTSLQFHKKKVETNFLYKGNAELILSKKNGKFNKHEIIKNIFKKKIVSGNYVNVNNYAVHRINAISDILLYEVSTPHLDDVIRLEDDKKRQNGRINSEHQ